eukprot:snap_masked-scaffold_2-processed-gene-20.20-mRNA-1 protein AED:0.06 eAED:0.06 QI:0/-1/0/1/-1/1/1/0/447
MKILRSVSIRRSVGIQRRSFSQPAFTHPHGPDFMQNPGKEMPVYMDYQATTPVDPRVVDSMMPYLTYAYGNPHSRTHEHGFETEDAVEKARAKIASLIGASPKEVVFTSGATESNNIAIKGVAMFYQNRKKHIITTQTEHKCVLDSCRWLQSRGFDVTFLPVETSGLIDLRLLEKTLEENGQNTSLVSIMGVNNEIGVVQPLEKIGQLCKEHKVFFHSDCAQMAGKMPLDVKQMNINLMSISSHKMYGPKGIGALYVQRKPRVRVEPLFSGGGQERGLRSGTLAPFLCVGMGKAAELCEQELSKDMMHVSRLSQKLLDGIQGQLEHVTINGSDKVTERYPGCINLSFAGVEGESLLMALKSMSVSSGSACTSASLEPSYVLRAIGVDEENAHTSIRFGIGRFTTEEEVDFVVDEVVKNVNRLREMSPLWEMIQDGIDLKTIQWTQDH